MSTWFLYTNVWFELCPGPFSAWFDARIVLWANVWSWYSRHNIMLGSRQQGLRMSSLRTMIQSEENISFSWLSFYWNVGCTIRAIVDIYTLKLNFSHLDYSCCTFPTICMWISMNVLLIAALTLLFCGGMLLLAACSCTDEVWCFLHNKPTHLNVQYHSTATVLLPCKG